jgi:hypothetical protein
MQIAAQLEGLLALFCNTGIARSLSSLDPHTDSFVGGLFAQVSVIQTKVDETLKLIQLLLLPVIVALVLYGGFCIHEGKVSQGIMAIAGALILALAVPIARALFNF